MGRADKKPLYQYREGLFCGCSSGCNGLKTVIEGRFGGVKKKRADWWIAQKNGKGSRLQVLLSF